jgi:hypothetical protein
VIRTGEDWQRTTDEQLAAIEAQRMSPRRVITLPAPAEGAASAPVATPPAR